MTIPAIGGQFYLWMHSSVLAPQYRLQCCVRHVRSADDPALAEMDLSELGIGIDEIELDWLHDRQIARLFASENPTDIDAGLAI